MDLQSNPPSINNHLSFKRIDSIFCSAGDMSGLMKIGDDKEVLFTRIVVASIVRCNLTRIGLGLD